MVVRDSVGSGGGHVYYQSGGGAEKHCQSLISHYEKEEESIMADKFRVMEGKQVMFSSDDRELCEGMANQKKVELVNRGVDIRTDEHHVRVVEHEEQVA